MLPRGGTYGWVGAGKPKPVSELDLATVQLLFAKSCGILVTTDELMRLGTPRAEALLRDELVRGSAAFLDAQFIDPTVTAVANVNPASITSAAVAITAHHPMARVGGKNAACASSSSIAAAPVGR